MNCRGLLTFAEGKPLGERGFEWLQIHLSNLAGYDKASNLSRKEFTLKHLEDIMDSADRPLEVSRVEFLLCDTPVGVACVPPVFLLEHTWREGDGFGTGGGGVGGVPPFIGGG